MPSPAPTHDRYLSSLVRYRDFRIFLTGQFVSLVGTYMQLVAINWHVYLITKSALALGIVGLFRLLPLLLFSLVGGAVADSYDRKFLLIGAQVLLMAVAVLLTLVTAYGLDVVWPIYLLTGISSVAGAFETPARQALVPSLVPATIFPKAVSFLLVGVQIAMIVGPILAGVILSIYGPAAVYAINALSFLAVVFALVRIPSTSKHRARANFGVSSKAIIEGLRFVRSTPLILYTMILDFLASATASVTILLPIFAVEILQVGPGGLGILAAAPALGAITLGFLMARYGMGRRTGLIMLTSVAIYGAATLAFGVSRLFSLSCILMAICGAADTISTVTRQTTRQLITPNRLRGRMTSINMIFFNGGPRLGEFQAGLLASVCGPSLAVVLGGSVCLLSVVTLMFTAKNLVNYEALDPNEWGLRK